MNMKSLLKAGSLLLIATSAFAQHEGGNGTGLVYLNGVPRLADPWMKADYVKSTMIISDEMTKLLKAFEALLEQRGIQVKPFFEKNVFSDLNEYVYATELPCKGREGLTSPVGTPYEDVACTSQSRTYILREKFESLSFLEQGLTLLHERLHAQFPEAAHDWITEFTAAMLHMIELKTKQAQGDRSMLTQEQELEFKNMYLVARKMGFKLSRDIKSLCRQFNFGGGLFCLKSRQFHGESILDQAIAYLSGEGKLFLGVGTVVITDYLEKDYSTWKNSVILDSTIDNSLLTDSVIVNSMVTRSTVSDSKIESSSLYSMSMDHSIADRCYWTSYHYRKNWRNQMSKATCKNTRLLGFSDGSVDLEEVQMISLQLEPGSVIENMDFAPARYTDGKIRLTSGTHVDGLHLLYRTLWINRFKLTFDSAQPLVFDPSHVYTLKTRDYGLFKGRHQFYIENVGDLDHYDWNQ